MGIPFYRFVESDSDGQSTYQCLLCKEYVCGAVHGWQFCPKCGGLWEGEMKWDEDKKDRHKLWYPYGKTKKPKPDFEMLIQERTMWRDSPEDLPWKDGYSKWSNVMSYWNSGSFSKYSLERWRLAIAESSGDEEGYYVGQVRLVARWPDGREKVLFTHLPTLKEKSHETVEAQG